MNAIAILSTNLSDILALPDEKAAVELNQRMAALEWLDRIHEVSYAERLIIIREFERRKLWQHLIDPDVGQPFPHMTAWLSSGFLGCRRVNMEAKRTGEMLSDVPAEKLIDVPKANIHVLTQLSTAVRNDPAILEAAKTLPQKQFLEKLEKEQPLQHLEVKSDLRFNPGRTGAKAIEEAIQWALEHDIAGSRDEALVRMAETALKDWQLDDELAHMPADEVEA